MVWKPPEWSPAPPEPPPPPPPPGAEAGWAPGEVPLEEEEEVSFLMAENMLQRC